MRAYALCLLVLIPAFTSAQKLKPQKMAKLPSQIKESSGLAVADSNLIWTMNDSGGGNILFLLNHQGVLIKTLLLNNADNLDWEDLATDSVDLYIGDFGNNSNRRKNLVIYKIPRVSKKDSDVFIPKEISYSYSDQRQFPPPPSNWNFDCEAFFHCGDSLFLFSKNNSNPNNGFTKLYRLPDHEGNFTAHLIDSFQLNEPVTAADISPDGKTAALLTYFSLWIFKDFPDKDFFLGKIFQFPFKGFTQKEGICFVNEHELFMSDECHFGKGGKLYRIDLNRLDFSHPNSNYIKPGFKRTIYDAFNNPKKHYRKIMRQEAAR